MSLYVRAKRQGIHCRMTPPGGVPGPGLILDRDGVLVNFVDYLHRPDETQLARGAAQLISVMRGSDVAVGVATNQAGIARSLYGWNEYFAVEEEIDRQLAAMGTRLDGVVACPHHPEFTKGWSEDHAYWRKPGMGMIALLITELNILRDRCWMIGDDLSDIQAAKNAELPGAILVKQGRGVSCQKAAAALADPFFEVLIMEDLDQALPLLADRLKVSARIADRYLTQSQYVEKCRNLERR